MQQTGQEQSRVAWPWQNAAPSSEAVLQGLFSATASEYRHEREGQLLSVLSAVLQPEMPYES